MPLRDRHGRFRRKTAYDLLFETFDELLAEALLWDYTCYPMDGVDGPAMRRHVKILIDAEERGELKETLAEIQRSQEADYKRIAASGGRA